MFSRMSRPNGQLSRSSVRVAGEGWPGSRSSGISIGLGDVCKTQSCHRRGCTGAWAGELAMKPSSGLEDFHGQLHRR